MSPPECDWDKLDVIPESMKSFNKPHGSRGTVVDVCRACIEDPACSPAQISPGRGRKPMIADFGEQAEIASRALEQGLSVKDVAVLLNTGYRATNGLGDISASAVQSFLSRHPSAVSTRRGTEKSGRTDPKSSWAMARLAVVIQFIAQLALGLQIAAQRAVTLATRGSSLGTLGVLTALASHI